LRSFGAQAGLKPRLYNVVVALALVAAPASAQTTSRPGPWVLDVRGVTSPVPQDAAFYPALDSSALVPRRGFGFDIGAHVYLFNLGASRVGVGATVVNIRAVTRPPAAVAAPGSTTTIPPRQSVEIALRHVAPQVSFNFGSRDGWSYLSAGAGPTLVSTKTTEVDPAERETGRLTTLNFGAGARWFLKSRLAFGFDIRFYRMDPGRAGEGSLAEPTPRKMLLTFGAGVSFR
jgi:hypothetical protein